MAYCLNFHAGYRCRHSGECCRAGWPIPFDREEAARVDALRLVGTPALVAAAGPDIAAFAATHADGHCIFFEPETRLCGIHRAAGERALPATCRMFPRVVLKDARGTFLTLSHYCPTAAALLLDADGPTRVVDAPASLIPPGELEGLDASEAWPPLLRPDVLMDHDSYALWERRTIGLLAQSELMPWHALEAIESATTALTGWSPGHGELRDAVGGAFDAADPGGTPDIEADLSLAALVLRAVPPELLPRTTLTRHPSVDLDVARAYSIAVSRWLAARLFGTWIAYQADGLSAIVRYLRACLGVLLLELGHDRRFIEAIRRSDYLLVHLADSQRLASVLRRAGAECEVRSAGAECEVRSAGAEGAVGSAGCG
jgi:Fe-S-cluster containining protein